MERKSKVSDNLYDDDCFSWNMTVFSREPLEDVPEDEKILEKKLEWTLVVENFPKECEIMFTMMKDYIIQRLKISFLMEMRKFKSEILENNE